MAALPVLKNVTQCADFSLTVLPYVPHLLSLPSKVVAAGRAQQLDVLKDIYLSTNPLVTVAAVSLLLAVVFLIVSEFNQNYSQVDRLWSILPVVYNAHYAIWARLNGLASTTVNAIAVLTFIWGTRLTFNYWRRGGYSIGSEDYRWSIIRSKVNNRFLFFLFNITFISLTQSLLLFFITTPTYVFLLLSTVPDAEQTGIPYLAFSRALLFFVILETVADQQQWTFQKAKRLYEKTARIPAEYRSSFTFEDLDRGFVVKGLWSLCRHPNCVAEQSFWVTLYVWACYSTETYVNWTGIGALGYILLFQGSTVFTESITANKYCEYRDYQARVGMFVPRFSLNPRSAVPSKKSKNQPNAPSKKKE